MELGGNLTEEEPEEEDDFLDGFEDDFEEDFEQDSDELNPNDVDAVPTLLCSEDTVEMDIAGTEIREEETRKFLFKKTTEEKVFLKYVCPECDRYFYYDMENRRQGCFIATAAYGTPFSKDINVLRRFRDSYLVHRHWGKKLVDLYYKVSPPVADVIERSDNLRKFVRTLLKPLVESFKRREKKSD